VLVLQTLDKLTRYLNSSHSPPLKKSWYNFSMLLATPAGREKRDMKYIGKLDRVFLIKVILLLLDRYIIFHPTKRLSIFSITPSQIDLALHGTPNGRPRYFKSKDDTTQHRILASPSIFLTFPIGTYFDFAKLIFKPNIASKHNNKAHR
jgi:hypothetical protein